MEKIEYFSNSPADTQRLGEKIGKYLQAGAVMALFGELGSGKTMLTRGICAGLGVPLRRVNILSYRILLEPY